MPVSTFFFIDSVFVSVTIADISRISLVTLKYYLSKQQTACEDMRATVNSPHYKTVMETNQVNSSEFQMQRDRRGMTEVKS